MRAVDVVIVVDVVVVTGGVIVVAGLRRISNNPESSRHVARENT